MSCSVRSRIEPNSVLCHQCLTQLALLRHLRHKPVSCSRKKRKFGASKVKNGTIFCLLILNSSFATALRPINLLGKATNIRAYCSAPIDIIELHMFGDSSLEVFWAVGFLQNLRRPRSVSFHKGLCSSNESLVYIQTRTGCRLVGYLA